MRYFLSFLAFFFYLSVFAQQEEIISNHSDTIRQTVSQDRRMLLDKFRDGRLDAVSDLLDSIGHHSSDRLLLWPAERLLLYYWIDRYHDIDSLAFHFDEFCEEALANHPQEQAVWNVLSFHSFENTDTLIRWIDETGCSDEIFDFRVRLLKTLLNVEGDDQTSVHREIRSLMDQYTFHEEEILPEEQPVVTKQTVSDLSNDDPWRVGFGFCMGPTYISGKIAGYLSVKANFSCAMNVNYQRWYFLLLMQAVFANLKRDFPVGNTDEVWESGKSAIITNIGLSLGYTIFDPKYFRISPFIGLSLNDCSPTEQQIENNSALKNAGIQRGFATMYGIDTEIKLCKIFPVMERKNFPVSLNVRLNYIPAMFRNVNARYAGNMFMVTFGIGMVV